MAWKLVNPNITNDPSYLDPRLSDDESKISSNTTSLAEKAQQYVIDVKKDYGAKGDYNSTTKVGTDDTIAIQNAINDAYSKGDVVYFPPGIYKITDELLIPRSIKITGAYEKGDAGASGVWGSEILQETTGKGIFVFTGDNYATEISKIRLSGKKSGIEINNGVDFSEFVFEKIHFNGGFDNCINMRGSIGRISDCDFSASKIGINLINATSLWIEHNNFWSCTSYNIQIQTALDVHFNNNWIEAGTLGNLLIQSPASLYAVTFDKNEFRSGGINPCLVIDGNTNPNQMMNLKYVRFTNCRFYTTNGANAIVVNMASNTYSGNNSLMKFENCIMCGVQTGGIYTDYKFLYWTLIDTRCYSAFDSGTIQKYYGSSGITPIIRDITLDGLNVSMNNGLTFLANDGNGLVENTLYLSSGGNLYLWKNSKANKVILAAGTGTAAPTTGTWLLGDYVSNTNPSEQGTSGSKYVIKGWICTVAGTPGTWVQDRALTGN